MFKTIYKYFILNKRVNLPGLGVLHLHREPASLDFGKKAFIAPSSQVTFTAGSAYADKNFYTFLAGHQQVGEDEAVQLFGRFTEVIKENLQANREAVLPGLGILSRDAAGTVRFIPGMKLPDLFDNAAIENRDPKHRLEAGLVASHETAANNTIGTTDEIVERKPAEKQTWWIFAGILAALAIAAIIYYYIQNGTLR